MAKRALSPTQSPEGQPRKPLSYLGYPDLPLASCKESSSLHSCELQSVNQETRKRPLPSMTDCSTAETSDFAFSDQATGCPTPTNSIVLESDEAHNRSYHGYHAGKYLRPSDDKEIERMSTAHNAIKLKMNNRNYHAPITDPTRILDIGTGSGIWCIDVAEEHPQCEVMGTDLSPVQDQPCRPNCQFYIEDADDTWVSRGDFDLIHTRDLHSHTTIKWPKFFCQAYLNLKPGGYLELHEFGRCASDNEDHVDLQIKELEDDCQEAMRQIEGTAFCDREEVIAQMDKAGFEGIHFEVVKLYLGKGSENDESGELWKKQMVMGLDSDHAKCLLDIYGYQEYTYHVLLMHCKQYLEQASGHLYTPMFIVYGRKPLSH